MDVMLPISTMKSILLFLLALGCIVGCAVAQTCPCINNNGEACDMIEASGTPGICNLVPSTCLGCVCVPEGQGTGTCELVSKQGLQWINKDERTCLETTIEFARCPTTGNVFEFTCSGSASAYGSFICTVPTQGKGSLDGLACSMDILWHSNFAVQYGNPSAFDLTGAISYSNLNTMSIGGGGQTDITTYFVYTAGGSAGSWVGPVFSDPTFSVASGKSEGVARFTGTAGNPRESNYISRAEFRTALNAASGNGASNVNMEIFYSLGSNDPGPFTFAFLGTTWSDTRRISCNYD